MYVALMFTTIHCKIKRILIVVICYSLGGNYSSGARQQAASATIVSGRFHSQVISDCYFCIIYPEICLDIFIEFNDETCCYILFSLAQTEHLSFAVTDNLNLHSNTYSDDQ